jgi:hypothetical protein
MPPSPPIPPPPAELELALCDELLLLDELVAPLELVTPPPTPVITPPPEPSSSSVAVSLDAQCTSTVAATSKQSPGAWRMSLG